MTRQRDVARRDRGRHLFAPCERLEHTSEATALVREHKSSVRACVMPPYPSDCKTVLAFV